jgi:serine protease AprX
MKKSIFAILISLVLVLGAGLSAQAQVIDQGLQELLDTLDPGDEVDVLVTLSDQVDVKKVKDKNKDKSKSELRTALIKELKDKKDKTQKTVKDFLKGKAIKVSSFWIFNGLAITATKEVIIELADQPGIESIRFDDILIQSDSVSGAQGAPTGTPEWNLNAIGAPVLWNLGYTGAGVVVASMDTGVDYNHADLSTRWRGGSNSWYDPNGEHPTPYDKTGHGTQVLGVLVGGDATGTAIGVAPGAKWIAVKMYNDAGAASYSVIHSGFQWLLDPDDNPNSNDSADVVNNSWGYSQLINQCVTEFRPDIQALKAAEIAVVFSGGNSGPYPSTSESPANYPESFGVGAVDGTLAIASSSSRGSSACDDGIYPKVTAPGVNIKTTDKTFGGVFPNASIYATGTSIAAPHVTGAMALLLDAFPGASVAELETALKDAAVDLGAAGPENTYGFGLVDVMAAYNLMDQGSGTCTDADGDGFYATEDCGAPADCNDVDASVYPGAPEVKHDGTDQDCNGYDLTIDIVKADYTAKRDTLDVDATSSLGKDANLELVGYGAMSWDRKKSLWKISLRKAGGNPGSVTVSGIEGSETMPIN